MRDHLDRLLASGAVRIVEREVAGQHELAAVTQASQRESDAPLRINVLADDYWDMVAVLR